MSRHLSKQSTYIWGILMALLGLWGSKVREIVLVFTAFFFFFKLSFSIDMHSNMARNGYYTFVEAQNLQGKSHHTKQYTTESVTYCSGYLILLPTVYYLDGIYRLNLLTGFISNSSIFNPCLLLWICTFLTEIFPYSLLLGKERIVWEKMP